MVLDNEYVLKASEAELENYFIDKVTIDPLKLHVDQKYIKDQSGTQIDVSHDFRRGVFPGERAVVRGTTIQIAIPFEGDPMLWRVRASTYSMSGYPEIDIRGNEISFNISFPDDSVNADRIQADINNNVQSLKSAVGYLGNDVANHNNSAPNTIKQTLQNKIRTAKTTIGAVASLEFL